MSSHREGWTDKANRDIHEAIEEILSARKKRRDAGQPHYDMSIFGIGNRFPRELPEPLRPSVNGMQSFQLAVYDKFTQLPGSMSSPSSTNSAASSSSNKQRVLEIAEARDAMIALLTKVDAVTRSMGTTVTRLESVEPSHELVRVLRQIYITATSVVPAQKDDAVMGIVRAILKRLFQTPRTPILVDSLFALLARLGQICDRVAIDVNYLVQNLDHTRKFDLEMIRDLSSRLLNVREYDVYLAKLMQQGQFLQFGAIL